MWSGYFDDVRIKSAVVGNRMEKFHTSGYADLETIETVVGIVNPSTVIPIHTKCPLGFPDSDVNVLNVIDGQEIII